MQLVDLALHSYVKSILAADDTKSLENIRITSRLDYCNVLLIGVPKTVLNKLQNTAVRLVTRTSRYTHTFKALHDESPTYIKQLLKIQTKALRSKELATLLVVPKSRTVTYGDRSFMTIAPKLWKDLPVSVKKSKTLVLLKGL